MIHVSRSELNEMARNCDFCRRKARMAVTLNSEMLFCVCLDHSKSLKKKFTKQLSHGIWTMEAESIGDFVTVQDR